MTAKQTTIDNTADILDSRDIIARIAELEAEREEYDADGAHHPGPWNADCADDAQELANLHALAEEADGCADWPYGEALIRDSYFVRYAQELADDIGAVKDNATWPNNCIDWERAARELRYDYTSVDFDGVTYWIRS